MKNKQIKSSTDFFDETTGQMLWAVWTQILRCASGSLIQHVWTLLSCHMDVYCSNDSLLSSELQPRHVCLLLSCRGAVWGVRRQRRIQGSGHILLGEGSAKGRTRQPVRSERHAAGEPRRVGVAVHLWVWTSTVPLFIHISLVEISVTRDKHFKISFFFMLRYVNWSQNIYMK